MLATACLCALLFVGLVAAQTDTGSFPHVYPGMPAGDFSPQWQSCTSSLSWLSICSILSLIDFQVVQSLPNVTFQLNRSFAGNIPVGRAGHPNNTLFFWAFEKENGSLTAAAGERSDEPWGIWLNGG